MLVATSAWVIINATTRRMASPKTVKFNIPEVHIPIGLEGSLESLELAHGGDERLRLRAGYSAVDLIGHVNNTRYVEWICDAFPIEMYTQHKLDWLQINYEHEVLAGEEVSILAYPAGPDANLWALKGRNLSNDTCAFEALLHWQE
jgi:acyl-ACP thioesterase